MSLYSFNKHKKYLLIKLVILHLEIVKDLTKENLR